MSSPAQEQVAPLVRPALFTAVLGLFMAFAPMSVDMYLPAMPTIATALGTGQAGVQLSLSSFFLGFGLGQLVWGPLGDRYGRRAPIAAGILLYLAGCVGCALASGIDQLVGFRFVQALGACAAPVLARAMIRDVYGRDQAARKMSMMMLVMGAAPMLAPLIGGQILGGPGWRAIFWTLCTFGLVAALGLASIQETWPPARRQPLRWMEMVSGYGQLLRHRRFQGYALTASLYFGGLFAYISGTPFVYIEIFGVRPDLYGFLFGLNIVGMIIVNLVNSRLVMRWGSDRLLRMGCRLAALFGVMLAVAGATGFGGLAGIVVPMFLYLSMMGLIGANSMAGALSSFPHMAGTASALAGTMQFGSGAIAGAIVGWLADGTPVPMTAMIGGLGLAALATEAWLLRRT